MRGEVLLAHLRRDADGRARMSADLGTAEAAAQQIAAGARVRLHTADTVGTVIEWAQSLERSRAATVVLVAEPDTEALASLIAARGTPGTITCCSARDLPATLADATGHEAVKGASPYRTGVLSAKHAGEAGLRVTGASELLADLDLLVRRGVGSVEVTLHSALAADLWVADGPLARGLARRSVQLRRAGLRLRARLPASGLTLSVVVGLAEAGVFDVTVTARLAPGVERDLRACISLATASGLTCSVVLVPDEGADVLDEARSLSAALRVIPDLELECRSEQLLALASAGALTQVLPHASVAVRVRRIVLRHRTRVEHAVGGRYIASPITVGVHDLWWGHDDDPTQHAAWLGDVLATGGAVLVGHQTSGGPSAAHVLVLNVSDSLAVTGWARPADTYRPTVLVLREAADRDEMLRQIDKAWLSGDLTSRLFQRGQHIGPTCRMGVGECPSAEGRSLTVDSAGVVRAGDGGPAVGRIGTPLGGLRSALRSAQRSAGAGGCVCLPREWEGIAPRPWIGRVLDASAALRGGVLPHEGVRVSGLGGALHHSRRPAAVWPGGLVLLSGGEDGQVDHVLWSRRTGVKAQVPAQVAAVLEMHLDLGADAPAALREHGASPAAVDFALASAASLVARLDLHPDPKHEQFVHRKPEAS